MYENVKNQNGPCLNVNFQMHYCISHIYDIYLLKIRLMDTSLSNAKRRKVIDIPEQTFRTLSVRAAASGTNLKAFIEKMLVDYADSADDSHLYAYLCEKRPEGKDMLNEEETKSFEDWLGL